MAKIIRNIDSITHIYAGQEIAASSSYTIQPSEELQWATEDELLVDIANGKAQVNNGFEDIIGVSNQISFLNGAIKEVTTQAEKDNRDKKLAKSSATIAVNSVGYLFTKCPGAMNLDGNGVPITSLTDDRWVNGGSIICNNAQDGDWLELVVTANNDPQNLVIVKSFTEAEESSDGKNGWFMDSILGSVDLESAAPAHLYAGFYLCVIYHAVGGLTARKVYMNIDWDQRAS